MEQEIIKILWEAGKIPKEVIQIFIIPYIKIKDCGCFFSNEKCKQSGYHYNHYKCIICKYRLRSLNTHYCDQCWCSYRGGGVP